MTAASNGSANHGGGSQPIGRADTDEAPARQGIQSVETAMTVLLTLERGGGPMTLTQLATASSMQPSKVHRYLVSLSRVGLVAQSSTTGQYDLGPALRRLGATALLRFDEVGVATDYLPELRDRTGQAVNLAVWGDHGPVIVRWDYGTYALPITVRVGATLPLMTSAVGRVYLAYLPETLSRPVLRAELSSDRELDSAHISDLAATVRRDGFASTSGGVIPGIYSIAAPVFTTGEQLLLAVAVAMPEKLAVATHLKQVTSALLETARTISEDLLGSPGASGPPYPWTTPPGTAQAAV